MLLSWCSTSPPPAVRKKAGEVRGGGTPPRFYHILVDRTCHPPKKRMKKNRRGPGGRHAPPGIIIQYTSVNILSWDKRSIIPSTPPQYSHHCTSVNIRFLDKRGINLSWPDSFKTHGKRNETINVFRHGLGTYVASSLLAPPARPKSRGGPGGRHAPRQTSLYNHIRATIKKSVGRLVG